MFLKRLSLIFILYFFSIITCYAQPSGIMDAAEIKLALKKLNVLGSVLYVGAHPDDENTAVLSYFSSGKLFRTGYLALTRGDGGQNLIGSEQGDQLGLIRTNELLEARKVDGAEQFFTRAIDFGYSKSPNESLNIWDKEKILSDVVFVIRKFRPDIIITRFPSDSRGGHGHHTASAVLAEEAFNLAGDKTKFPEQLKCVEVWQPTRLYWNSWIPRGENQNVDLAELISIDLGSFNKLLGKSYSEISALSRTSHKSQGFGSSGRRGETLNYFSYVAGSKAKTDLSDNIDVTWNRVNDSQRVKDLLASAEENFDENDPSKSLPILIDTYKELSKLPSSYWKDVKLKALKEVIRSCAGIWIECISPSKIVTQGDHIELTPAIVNRSNYPVSLKSLQFNFNDSLKILNENLLDGKLFSTSFNEMIPDGWKISNPYWLEYPHKQGTYKIENDSLIGMADFRNELTCRFNISFNGTEISYDTPVYFRWTDPVDGERYSLLTVSPPVSIRTKNKAIIFPDNNAKTFNFSLVSHSDNLNGTVKVLLSENWKIEPQNIPFSIKNSGEEKELSFRIFPPEKNSEAVMAFKINTNKGNSENEIIEINYKHILPQTYFPKAEIKLVKVDLQKKISSIGYLMGAGDEIPDNLRQIGYKVTNLTTDDLELKSLKQFDTVIMGVRAYNTIDKLRVLNPNLLEYVNSGGTVLVQYNTNGKLATEDIGPYPFHISRDRVTEENSQVKYLNPDHQLLNYPNKILLSDFDGWVQERGLYFPDSWDPKYETVIGCNDEGETLKTGGILFTKYGKGVFIYTGYSFFRQLPEGVPGAYKLFVNLISAKNK